MATYTWNDVFNLALRDSGVAAQGQTPNAQMAADAKMRCQMFLSQWQRKRWLVYHLIDVNCPMDGSLSYSLGPGQVLDTPRTDQLDAVFVRQINPAAQPNQPDYPCRIIKSYEEYSRITLKKLSGGPSWSVFYDSGYPNGAVYAWPLSSNQYELHCLVKAALPDVGNLTDDIILPPEYIEPIYANSVVRTRAAFRLPPDPFFIGLAKTTLQTLRSANFQVATLQVPQAALGTGVRGGYNALSDTFGPNYR